MAKRKDSTDDWTVVGILGAIAAIALLSSNRAYKNARRTEVPLIIEEGNALYKIYPDGRKEFIKNLPKSNRSLPPNFTLK